jgi:hypothetical protein
VIDKDGKKKTLHFVKTEEACKASEQATKQATTWMKADIRPGPPKEARDASLKGDAKFLITRFVRRRPVVGTQ